MFRRKRRDEDFAAEIEAHIQLEADRLRAEGLSTEAAQAAAMRAFGNRTSRQEQFYNTGRSVFWEHLRRDLRYAVRAIARERSFSAFAVLLIGLGAGLTAAMFALYNGVVLRKLAVPEPDSLVYISDSANDALRYAMFERLRDTLDIAGSMFAHDGTIVPVTYGKRTQIVSTLHASGDLTGTMRIRPILGRSLTPSDDSPVAVISDKYWRRIGSDPDIVGKVLRAGPVALTIVGVIPAHSVETIRYYKSDLVVPLRTGILLEGVPQETIGHKLVSVTARLKRGVTQEQAQHRLEALWARIAAETVPAGQAIDKWAAGQGRVEPGSRGRTFPNDKLPQVTRTLLLLSVLVSLAMCTNLAGLLLSRSIGKQKEFGVRLALGAGRWPVIRYALVEVLVLACAGGIAAILLTPWVTHICIQALSDERTIAADYGVKANGRVLLFGLLLCVVTAIAAQLLPALRLSSIRVADTIKSGAQTFSARLGGRKAVLVVQVAASLVLVSGSLLFVRTLQSLARIETGFETRNLVAVKLTSKVPWSNVAPDFFHELLRRMRAIPGVTAAGLTDRLPMEVDFEPRHAIAPASNEVDSGTKTDRVCVWPGYFEALRTPVLAGRDIQASDSNAVLVTRTLADSLFPRAMPVGQYVRLGASGKTEVFQVVGVVGDVRLRSPRQAHTRTAFVPCHHVWKPLKTSYIMGLAIRAEGSIGNLESVVREHVEAMGKQAVSQVIPVERMISKSIRNESALSRIATGFGAIVLFLTCAGIYALIDLTVQSRRRELGVRMALGANGCSVLTLILGGVGRIVAIGAAVGVALTYAVSRAFRAYLYGVADSEPWLIAGAVVLVALFALIAALAPARRAVRIEPGTVLRAGV